MWIYIIGGIILVCLGYVLYIYNHFMKLQNMVDEAFSTMDVYLKKRWDLIPNLVETVKKYSAHEKETLEGVIKLRNRLYDNLSFENKAITNDALSPQISKLIALKEEYPELKANEHFMNLSNELVQLEDEIANSRKYYNAVVRKLNNAVEMFPSNIFAGIFKVKQAKMFEAKKEEKENIDVIL